jgi:alanine dehydrogenase
LTITDILVDATQRHDTSIPLVPNEWLGLMPAHAVVCDLVVDPYLLDHDPIVVRGIEGIPQGDLDQWVFPPDHGAWDAVPPGIATGQRRTVVSCYSWPGVRPEPCMHVYGSQLSPILETILRAGGLDAIRPDGAYHERAIWRASLRAWLLGRGAAGGTPAPESLA